MSATRELFAKNKLLREKWAAVASADYFREVLNYARSEFFDHNTNADQATGAKLYERILLTLCDPDYEPPPPIKSPLVHAIDNPRREIVHQTTKKEK